MQLKQIIGSHGSIHGQCAWLMKGCQSVPQRFLRAVGIGPGDKIYAGVGGYFFTIETRYHHAN